MIPTPAPTDRDQAELTAGQRKICHGILLRHLASAAAHAGLLGDPALAAIIRAVAERAASPVTPYAVPGSPAAMAWSERRATQLRGWEVAVARIDRWQTDHSDHTPIADLCREVFLTGIDAGIDSIIPEWSHHFLREFLVDLTGD